MYSDELYDEYKLNSDFFIYRFEDYLYIWKLKSTDQLLPPIFQETEITIKEHTPIFTKIVESAIVEFFKVKGRQVFRQKYSSIWETELKKEQQKNFGALSVRPTLVFSLRNLYSTLMKKQVIALTIRRRMKPIFTGSEEFIKKQLTDIRGLTQNDKGKIIASSDNLDRYLEATGQKRDYRNYLGKVESPLSEFEALKKYAGSFNEIAPNLYLPNGLKILEFLFVNLPSASFHPIRISNPTYFYHNERTKRGYYNEMVSILKPYSFDLFSGRRLNILAVASNEHEGTIGEYIVKLDKKLRTLFHLTDVNFHLKTAQPPETPLNVLDKIDAKNYDLAIILISQRDKEIPAPQSPYYLTKAKLLNQRLPTQELTIEVIRRSTENCR